LLFGGIAPPDDYDLDTDALRGREASALVDVIDRDGVLYNRIAQLFPLRAMRMAHDMDQVLPEAAFEERGRYLNSSPNAHIPAESQGILDEDPPW
jgi:hypothetical protein